MEHIIKKIEGAVIFILLLAFAALMWNTYESVSKADDTIMHEAEIEKFVISNNTYSKYSGSIVTGTYAISTVMQIENFTARKFRIKVVNGSSTQYYGFYDAASSFIGYGVSNNSSPDYISPGAQYKETINLTDKDVSEIIFEKQ